MDIFSLERFVLYSLRIAGFSDQLWFMDAFFKWTEENDQTF